MSSKQLVPIVGLLASVLFSSGAAYADQIHPIGPPPKLIPSPSLILPTPTTKPTTGVNNNNTNAVGGAGLLALQAENAIDQEYARVSGILGSAVGDVVVMPRAVTAYRKYQAGRIFYTVATGAHEVHGEILVHYLELNGPDGVLGAPTTDEGQTPDKVGRFNHFSGGSIYWTPSTGAHEIHGAIRAEYASLGWERGPLGYPTTDELTTPDGIGRYNHFQNGSIYWTTSTGAHEVHGAVRDRWANLGWEQSYLGYPTSDTTFWADSAGRDGNANSFQYGQIGWSPAGTVDIPEVIVHRENIETPSGTALGGWAEVELRSNGISCFRGGMHDSGFDNYSFVISGVVMPSDNSTAFVLSRDGSVEGTASWTPWHDAQRQYDWPSGHLVPDPNNPPFGFTYVPPDPSEACASTPNPDLRNHWPAIRNGTIQIRHEYKAELVGDLTGYLQQVWNDYKQELISAGVGAVVVLLLA